MQMYPAQELERAMKVKEVITRAMSGQINWIQAARDFGDVGPPAAAVAAAMGGTRL